MVTRVEIARQADREVKEWSVGRRWSGRGPKWPFAERSLEFTRQAQLEHILDRHLPEASFNEAIAVSDFYDGRYWVFRRAEGLPLTLRERWRLYWRAMRVYARPEGQLDLAMTRGAL